MADPSVLYTSVRPEAAQPPPTGRDRAEAEALYSMYGSSMRGEIEKAYRVELPLEGTGAAESDAPASEDDMVAISDWGRTATVPPAQVTMLRAAVSDAMSLDPQTRAARTDAWAADTAGKFGDRLSAVIALARTAVPPQLKPILNRTGLGSRTDIIEFFWNLAQQRSAHAR